MFQPAEFAGRAPASLVFHFGGEALHLLAQKAVWWPSQHTLLVADVHIGKAVSFRKLGVAVPRGTTSETLGCLSALIQAHRPRRVVFLGDFLHSAHAHAPSTLGALARWRSAHADIELTLVRGNHDHRAGDPPANLHIDVVDEPLIVGGLALCHHPVERPLSYVIGGHLHPCVGVGERANDHLRLPCFHFSAHVGVLPAFGAFTGMHPIELRTGDRVFAVAEDSVVELR